MTCQRELLDYGKMSLTNWWNGNNSLQAKYPDRDGFPSETHARFLSQNNSCFPIQPIGEIYNINTGITKSIGVNILRGKRTS